MRAGELALHLARTNTKELTLVAGSAGELVLAGFDRRELAPQLSAKHSIGKEAIMPSPFVTYGIQENWS